MGLEEMNHYLFLMVVLIKFEYEEVFHKHVIKTLGKCGVSIGEIEQMPTPFQSAIMKYEFREYLKAMEERSKMILKVQEELAEYDAVWCG